MTALLTIASGVIGAIGQIRQGNAARAQGDYNAKLAERDAVIVEQNRQATVAQAQTASEDLAREHRRDRSSMRVAYGTSGLDMTGSILDVLEDTGREQALDVARVRHEGSVRSREGAIKTLGLSEDATLSRMGGKARQTGSYFAAGGTLLSSAAKAASQAGDAFA